MPAISTGLALAIGLGAAGAGTATSAILASKAAGAQAGAARNAAGLQFQLGEDQLAFNKQQYTDTIARMAPFLKAGTSGINLLSSLLSTPGQGLLTPWDKTFAAPTAEQARQTPGYQFVAGAGSGAIQDSAAASGNLLSTGTLKTLSQFNQGLADTTYSETYNRAFNEYLTQYNQFQQTQNNEFNRLASISGLGQTAANTLSSAGSSAAGIGGSIAANTGSQVGNSLLFGGSANASGYAGIANAINSGIGSATGQIQGNQFLSLLQAFMNNGGGGGGLANLSLPGIINSGVPAGPPLPGVPT
jgi:hypothetical protein